MGPSPMYDHLVPDDAGDLAMQDGDGKPSLMQIVCGILDMKEEDVSLDVPLTSYGLDSLSAASLSFALRPIITVSQLQLLADLTIKDLLARAEEVADASEAAVPPAPSPPVPKPDPAAEKVREMEALVVQLSADLEPSPVHGPPQRDTLGSIVVTGTTGSLGSHVLAHLLGGSGFKRIYALVRRDSHGLGARERQTSTFEYRGLDTSLLESPRLRIVECALDQPLLGMSKDSYEEVSCSASTTWPLPDGHPDPD